MERVEVECEVVEAECMDWRVVEVEVEDETQTGYDGRDRDRAREDGAWGRTSRTPGRGPKDLRARATPLGPHRPRSVMRGVGVEQPHRGTGGTPGRVFL